MRVVWESGYWQIYRRASAEYALNEYALLPVNRSLVPSSAGYARIVRSPRAKHDSSIPLINVLADYNQRAPPSP